MSRLIIALAPATAAYLAPDGRTYRCDLATEDDVVAAAVHAWSLEFPEIPSAHLWLDPTLAAPATARRFRTAARQAGLRADAAWPLPESFTLTEPDDALADRLAELRTSLLTESHNLLRRPKLELRVNWRRVGATAALFLAAMLCGILLHQRARRREREATSSAAAEREAEFAAAGRRRERTLASAQALLAAARPPPQYAGALLRALSDAIPLSAVADELTIDGPNFTLQFRPVANAPGAITAAALFRKALFPPAAPWRLATPPPDAADPLQPLTFNGTVATPPSPASAPEIQSSADEARAALPPPAALDTFLRAIAAAWTIESAPARAALIPTLQVTLAPRTPSAWPALLELTAQLAAFPGASIDHLEAKSGKDPSGSFETLALTVTFRLRPSDPGPRQRSPGRPPPAADAHQPAEGDAAE